ncbi:glycoside hydrolase family 16 protein [Saccharothrix sp. AJ9571]|nr:glycoside hydrolase family 16 protein [Saccharothrix sp. AJ9571]
MNRRIPVAVAALLATALAIPTGAAAAPAACAGVLFDDFAYDSHADPRLAQRGWQLRNGGGGPGVGNWSAANATFPVVDGQPVLQLSAHTDGTTGGTSQAEVMHQRKFYEGTYSARVRFSDVPVSGADGDHLVQTFFTITPLAFPNDPNYGELDFEYLPNGGWGESGATMFLTSWETYQPDPWVADNRSTAVRSGFAGWRTLTVQVSGGTLRYFIGDQLVATHDGHVYPETPMMLAFQEWFIDHAAHSGGRSTYQTQNDWVYYTANEVLSPAGVQDRVNGLRANGTKHTDSATC